jgi:hypothetical protein
MKIIHAPKMRHIDYICFMVTHGKGQIAMTKMHNLNLIMRRHQENSMGN